MKFNKKRFAKEWLIFIGAIVFSFLLPLFVVIVIGVIKWKFLPFWELYGIIFKAISDGDYTVYIAILLPYIIIQFIRSIIWSVKVIKFYSR